MAPCSFSQVVDILSSVEEDSEHHTANPLLKLAYIQLIDYSLYILRKKISYQDV